MMKYFFKPALVAAVLLVFFSCNKDDDSSTTANVNPLSEQAPIDEAAIIAFLESHYYNEEEFANVGGFDPGVFSYEIKFYTNEVLAGVDANGDGDMTDTNETAIGYDSNGDGVIDGNDLDSTTPFNRTLLINLPANVLYNKVITLTDATTDEVVDHNLYILNINQGGGADKPKFSDRVLLNYRGYNLDLDSFDANMTSVPSEFDLTTLVKGFSEGVTEFNVADSSTPNGDGTYTYNDFGVGAAIMPSALGYYAAPIGTDVDSYSPLIFTLKVFAESQLDHDGDGVPSFAEDLNGDRDLTTDDTDEDTIGNAGDNEDDGDTVLTREEVEIEELTPYIGESDPEPTLAANEYIIDRRIDVTAPIGANVVYTIVRLIDTDGDGTPNYLDTDDDGDGTLTKNEDADGDGQVTDDDTDGDGIPDYLDTDN